ncbi:MAG TPA: efflux RND transporter periplasmic adaptor subunit [Blastocatellia bacterium]|nr:efflux RND transporter periplasmic adaptor subunit [Blastocatellia bacterium]
MSRLIGKFFPFVSLVIALTISATWLTACKSSTPQNAIAQGARGGEGGRGGGGRGGGGEPLQPRTVRLVTASDRTLTQMVTATGTLAADEQAALSFRVAGRLAQLSIDLGSVVRKGQAIAKLETIDFKQRVDTADAALQQARARLGLPPTGSNDRVNAENTALVREARAVLDSARAIRDRTRQLVSQGIQAKADLDQVESSYKVAESRYQDALEEVRNREAVLLQRRSELELAKQQLTYTTLYAPFDGAIQEKRVSIGEYLATGAPIATLVRLHPLRLRAEVPERESFGIRPGLGVKVTVEGDSNTYVGRVARISPAFQEQSRTLIVEAEVDNQHGRLRPGAFVKAELQTSSQQAVVTIPASALVTFAGIQKVFLNKDGKAIERTVVVGRKEADWVEITEGLTAGEQIIDAPGNMVGGQPLIIQP